MNVLNVESDIQFKFDLKSDCPNTEFAHWPFVVGMLSKTKILGVPASAIYSFPDLSIAKDLGPSNPHGPIASPAFF